jgi:type I restriction enzyme M protein
VSFLDDQASRDLIQRPVEGRLRYTPEAVDKICNLTSGQPYLIQCLCNALYDAAVVHKVSTVQLRDVDQAARALIESNEHFSSLWDYVGTFRRRFLLMLIQECAQEEVEARLGVLQERFSEYRLDVEDLSIADDLKELMELELVSRRGDSHNAVYGLTIPLMGMWMERQKDFDDVLTHAREEIEHGS